LKKGNVILWILWALFSTESYVPEWEDEINRYLVEIEQVLGHQLDNGYSNKPKAMRLTFDPVVILHRPLVWYIVSSGNSLTPCIYTNIYSIRLSVVWTCGPHFPFVLVDSNIIPLRNGSIRSHPVPKLYYPKNLLTRTCRIGTAHIDRQRNLLFYSSMALGYDLVHWCPLAQEFNTAIQIGIWIYLPFFSDLIAQDPDIGILIIEILPISMHMTSPPLSRNASCRAIMRILTSLKISRLTLVSHSFGTVISTHILHDPFLSPLISSMLFIDPIPFLLHHPSVAFNFVYRTPCTANEWALWYFASRDADISRALSRHFFWTENVLWKEELEGRRVGVVLSGEDQIVDAEEVRKYLTGEQEMSRRWENNGLEVLFYPGLDHGTIFDTSERRKPMLDIIYQFVRLE
jgi:hypothetical protein